jgi:MinD superfamily P-loop ATPase
MNTPGLLITSGKGGVGKTLLATNTALELSKYIRIALVDADIRAPNLTYVMGIPHGKREFRNHKLIPYKYSDTLEVFSTDHFFAAENDTKRAIMPTGEEVRSIVSQSINAVDWNSPDLFVIDSDPSTGDVFFAVRDVFGRMLSAIVVTTNDISSLLDCERTIDALMLDNIPVLSIVGNMIWNGEDAGIRELCNKYSMHYAGGIPYDQSVRIANNHGIPGLENSEVIRYIIDNILHRRPV